MSFRRATQADRPALESFLRQHAPVAMFPLANLMTEGLARPLDRDNPPRSLHAYVPEGADMHAVCAITDEGMLLPVLPGGDASVWDALRPLLAGRFAMGIAGEARMARAGLSALGLDRARMRLAEDEPHYLLELAALKVPDCTGMTLVAPDASDRRLLHDWRIAYHVETLGTPQAEAARAAERDLDGWLSRDAIRILLRDGVPVSMSGLNATAGDIVQVGGVFTPPELRRQGLARRAVALALAEQRAAGVTRATLFAASTNAAKAYEAIGFDRIGDYTLALFADPAEIAG